MAQAQSNAPEDKLTTKIEFVRGMPQDMPAADVVKKADEAGMTMTAQHVRVIRSNVKRSASKGAKPKKGEAPKKAAGKLSKPATTKPAGQPQAKPGSGSAFIRALPRTMPLDEVMDRAKKAGLSFSRDLIRKARTTDPLAATKTSKAKPKPSVKKAPKPVSKPSRAPEVAKVKPLRGKAKKTAAAKPRPVAPPKPVAPVATRKLADLPTPEMVFVRLALDIGLQKAQSLLAAVDGKLATLVASI